MSQSPASNAPSSQEVLALLRAAWHPQPETETVPLAQARQRVLAKAHYSKETVPVFRASAMDGIAVSGSRFENGIPDTAQWQLGVDFVRADTGDDFPDEFDTVIAIENVPLVDGNLVIDPATHVSPGQNVRPRGSSITEGALLVKGGTALLPSDLAVLAMGGIETPEVITQPKVAFIPTGNELVALGTEVKRGHNIDGNSFLAEGTLEELGAIPLMYPIVSDSKERLKAALESALEQADIVIINGGSSKGEEDFNARLLEEEGEVLCHWIAMAPGRPLALAVMGNKPVVVMPGPPLATFNTFEWLISPLLAYWYGVPPRRNCRMTGTLTETIGSPAHIEFLVKVNVGIDASGDVLITPTDFRKDMVVALTSNALYYSRIGDGPLEAGTRIEVELLRNLNPPDTFS